MRDQTLDPEAGGTFFRPEVQETLLSRWKDLHRAGGALKVLRHLLRIDDPDRLYPVLIRIVRLLNGSVDSAGLPRVFTCGATIRKENGPYAYYAYAPREEEQGR